MRVNNGKTKKSQHLTPLLLTMMTLVAIAGTAWLGAPPPAAQGMGVDEIIQQPITKDTFAESGYPNVPPDNAYAMALGYDTLNNKYKCRLYLEPTLPSLPPGATINSAALCIYQYGIQGNSTDMPTWLYNVTSPWDGLTLTWNNQPSWGSLYADYTVDLADGWKCWPVTQLVRDWYGGLPNYGVVIRPVAEGAGEYAHYFWASEKSAYRPYLQIDYTVPPPPTTTPVPPPPPTTTPVPPTYSISGRVVDGSGAPISGVTISAGGHTATTNGNGDYTINGLPAGGYTITASKAGYTFVPASRTAAVPPNATGQNFSGTPVPPPPSCEVPYYSQVDPRWKNHPLRTCSPCGKNSCCSCSCNTIGRCGCTLTSATMIFGWYGSTRNPASQSDCMGNAACPFYWVTGANCSQGKATWVSKYSFSWSRLQTELNQNHRPVILGMHRWVNGQKHTHWVVVLSGSGSSRGNYTIHDPGVRNGAYMRLSAYNAWTLDWISVYRGTPPCGGVKIVTPDLPHVDPLLPATDPAAIPAEDLLPIAEAQTLATSSVFTGSIEPYRMTDVTMTVALTASSPAGEIIEMLVWTDSMTQTAWQPFQYLVYLPVSEQMYVIFRDSAGNISNMASTTLFPQYSPGDTPFEIYFPLISK